MRSYRLLTSLIAPVLPLWLYWRKLKGKEDSARMKERFGIASKPRPKGLLLWLHAASVGEANSVLLLIEKLRARFPDIRILLTTGTVTSAQLMQKRLAKDVIHQYAPVDTPKAVDRFIWHWRPDMAFWVESEFWPNLVMAADDSQCFMGVINGRMSERSFRAWQKCPAIIRHILGCFNIILAQSEQDAAHLQSLGAKDVIYTGNLKYDAALLPCDEAELLRLKTALGGRPVWLAASTHPGEEELVAQTHTLLSATRPTLLTVIVPRHPERGGDIAQMLKKYGNTALRSKGEAITPDTRFYIANTLGELGLFYRLCELVFMGGSLVNHGGQNPLEPARLSCAIVTGPYTHNFTDIYQGMEQIGACLRVTSATQLAVQMDGLMNNSATTHALQTTARKWVEEQGGAANRVIELLAPLFQPGKPAS